MGNWYQGLPTGSGGTGSREPLPEGNYNHRTKKSLYIGKLLEARQVGDDKKTTRHTYVVNSDQEKGSAFLKIDLQDHWLRPEAIAIAFRKRDKEGKREAIAPEILAHLDVDMLTAVQKQIEVDAEAKVDTANTPDEARHDAIEKAVSNTLMQIQINVGTIFRLCDWAGVDRSPTADLGSFEDVEFEGAIKHNVLGGKVNAEVSVYSKPVNGAVKQRAKATDFTPAQMNLPLEE